jgi:hypothetical protein
MLHWEKWRESFLYVTSSFRTLESSGLDLGSYSSLNAMLGYASTKTKSQRHPQGNHCIEGRSPKGMSSWSFQAHFFPPKILVRLSHVVRPSITTNIGGRLGSNLLHQTS